MSADTPGFLANRILMPYINEAIICLENVRYPDSGRMSRRY